MAPAAVKRRLARHAAEQARRAAVLEQVTAPAVPPAPAPKQPTPAGKK